MFLNNIFTSITENNLLK